MNTQIQSFDGAHHKKLTRSGLLFRGTFSLELAVMHPLADAAALGIMRALMGGVLTASRLMGSFGYIEIMRAVSSPSAKVS